MKECMMVDDNIPTNKRPTDSDIIGDIISIRNTGTHDAVENADDGNEYDPDWRDSELQTSLGVIRGNYFEQCKNSNDFLIS